MRIAIGLCIAFGCRDLHAQTNVWQPSPGHTQVPIWPKEPPDPQPLTGPETLQKDPKNPVAGKLWYYADNVSRPTITVYSPKGKNTGAAAIVWAAAYEVSDHAMA